MKKSVSCLFDHRGAVRAARCVDVDLALTERTFLCGRGCFGFLIVMSDCSKPVHSFHQGEDNDRHDEEIDDGGQEASIGKDGDACFLRGGKRGKFLVAAELDEPVGKINAARDKADDRHDKIVYQGIDDRLERAADDNADCQIHDISAHDKCFKFVDKFLHNSRTLLCKIY